MTDMTVSVGLSNEDNEENDSPSGTDQLGRNAADQWHLHGHICHMGISQYNQYINIYIDIL